MSAAAPWRIWSAKRAETGRFKDIFDFTGRLDAQMVNKRQLENLVCAGAMDGIAPNRRQAFDAIELILRHAHSAASDRDSPQENLFGGIDTGPKRFSLPVVEDWPVMERLRHEFEAIGFYLSAHPLDAYSASLRRLDAVKFGDLPAWLTGRPNTRAKMAGVVVSKQERTSARGNRFAFVQLSDASGIFETMVFSELLGASRELLVPGTMVFLTADVRTEGDLMRLTAQTFRPLDEAVAGAAAGLRIFLREPEALDGIKTHHPARRPREGEGQPGPGAGPRPRGGGDAARHLDDLRRHPPGDQVAAADSGCAGRVAAAGRGAAPAATPRPI